MSKYCKFLITIFCVLGSFASWCQDDEFFVHGTIKNSETLKKVDGVKVEVQQNGTWFDDVVTTSSGKYEFTVPLGFDYRLKFSKEGMVSKIIAIDTRNIPEEDRRGGFRLNMDMTLFDYVKGFDTSILDQPIGKAGFDAIQNSIIFDNDYTARIQQKIKNEFDRLENLDAELAKLRKEFETEIQKGDQKMIGKKWEDALGRYEKAVSIAAQLTDEDLALAETKRDEAQTKVDEANAESELEAKYNALISEGNSKMKKEEWEDAKESFNEALALKPAERLPQDKLKEIDKILAGLLDQEQYDALVSEGDELFESEDYALAIDKYKAASDMKPKEAYPVDQIKEAHRLLDILLSDAARQKKMQEDYDNLIFLADRNFKNDNWDDSRRSYVEASGIFPDERYPQDKIDEIDGILADMADNEEKNRAKDEANAEAERIEKEYQALIDAANVKFDKDELAAAKEDYLAALELKSKEKFPKSRIARIDDLLADLAEESAKADEADLEEERRLAEDQAAEEQRERERLAEEERLQRIADSQAEQDRLADERARLEAEDKARRERLLSSVDSSKEDEVEKYYREARRSEQAAKYKNKEKEKQDYADWLARHEQESEDLRSDRKQQADGLALEVDKIHRDGAMLQEKKGVQMESEKEQYLEQNQEIANLADRILTDTEDDIQEKEDFQAGLSRKDVYREERIRTVEHDKSRVREQNESVIKKGDALRADNEYKVKEYKTFNANTAREGEDVRQDRIQDKQRSIQRVYKDDSDAKAAAKERLATTMYQKEKEKREYAKIGENQQNLTENRIMEIEKAKRDQQAFYSEKEREASNARYEKRKELFEKDSGQERDVDDYFLTDEARDLPEGVSENSYQLNERTVVIERTVKIGNRVENYRKVISKTGTYYFKGNRAITEAMWKSETMHVSD